MVSNRFFSFNSWLWEFVYLAVLGPLFLFPNQFPQKFVILGLFLLLLPFGWRWWQEGRVTRRMPANIPLLILLILLFISLIITPIWEVTWSKFTSLSWSLAVFFAIVNAPSRSHNPHILVWLTTAYLALGTAFAVVSLLGLDVVGKFPALVVLGERLPHIFGAVFHANEVAGMLTLFTPLAITLCFASLRHPRTRWWLFPLLVLLSTLFLGLALLTQSRGSWLALAITILIVIVLLGRKWGWFLIAGGVIGLFLFLEPEQWREVWQSVAYAGASHQYSLDSGRIPLWQQAWQGVQDFPLWGMGLGTFRYLAPILYPRNLTIVDISHAHNLFLQTALDFGWLGGVAFVALWGMALWQGVRLAGSTRSEHALEQVWLHAWAVGSLASLSAHGLYSLTDAVALGAKPGVALWFLLGMILGGVRQEMPASNIQTKQVSSSRKAAKTIISTAVILLIFGSWVWWGYSRNRIGLLTTQVLWASPTAPESKALIAEINTLVPNHCRLYWYGGLLYHHAGEATARNTAWREVLVCNDDFIPYMEVLAPEQAELAEIAIAQQPMNASSFFWGARVAAEGNAEKAIQLYRQGLSINPEAGLEWRELGDLLVGEAPQEAIDAYLQSCYNGDPGANGCWRAGQVAERQGKRRLAISYYRLSRWSGALQRADELEQEVSE